MSWPLYSWLHNQRKATRVSETLAYHMMATVLATARSKSHLCFSSDEHLENVINILSGLVFSLKKKNIPSLAECVELVIFIKLNTLDTFHMMAPICRL